ncbi:VOC family protein [Sphingobium phenoxybenzoativorans]|uniref:VOC family protein n=1 Tax=Sphingobium phenoxybenzoativorans TaxID=1592790 RepID=A0A975Q369_9SPHN|nr:VOC family protein [Sphingobium phenoxybenzoativorans]QUT07212.1 VOC family protein [Sphingobium phenoxybenzoativorans]
MPRLNIQLGYAGFAGDMSAWLDFGCGIYGLQALPGENELRFRIDDRAWRIAIRQSDTPGVDYIGLEVGTLRDLQAIAGRLRQFGHQATENRDLAKTRNVFHLIETEAPDGTRIELFVGGLTLSEAFVSPTGARFVTGSAGLGHVLLLVPDIEAALAFFVDVIGLRRTDSIEVVPGSDGHFLNGGKRHHVVALAHIPGVTGFDHIYLEVDRMSTVGRAWDKVSGGAAPVARSLGQHANDPALSFYAQSPSGFLFEYGFASTLIDDPESWTETRWESAYLWGGTFGSHAVG